MACKISRPQYHRKTMEYYGLEGLRTSKTVLYCQALIEVIEEVWAAISGEMLPKLYRNIPKRMLAVLDNK